MIVSLLHPNYMEATASLRRFKRISYQEETGQYGYDDLTDVGQRRTNNQDYANQYKNKAGKYGFTC